MSAPLSVIIPTLNAADALPRTASALLGGVTEGLIRELVISDGGSEDDTPVIARELGARFVTGSKGRGGQLARGIAASSGDWLLLLHADTHLAPGWIAPVRVHMAATPEDAGWFHLGFRATGLAPRLVERGANFRARYLNLPYGDQGLLLSRRTLKEVGGMPELALMEDVELARRLRGRLRPLGAQALTSADRYQRDGWARRTTRNLGTLLRYRLGTPIDDLIRRYDDH